MTRIQRRVLDLLIKETQEHGPPVLARIREVTGVRNPRGPLELLVAEGYVTQAYPLGPYIPIRDAEGRSLRLRLEVVEVPSQEPTP